ncbi:hypothetical protein PsYK624_161240 [Phanerochaete sordida]|uniref:Uncharacterized protein n=1 Tax=Phanerochaete sordida TaxID=48140 RepID=A0A9P3LLY6_9APHY|nr:hypothetical protein PsYK624_161240 [Phanerochaete sordida]
MCCLCFVGLSGYPEARRALTTLDRICQTQAEPTVPISCGCRSPARAAKVEVPLCIPDLSVQV